MSGSDAGHHDPMESMSSAASSSSTMTESAAGSFRHSRTGAAGATNHGGTQTGSRRGTKTSSSSEWEILGSLELGVDYNIRPKRHEGELLKKRKWPMKGWHKRYFVLESGVLTYGKNASELSRGRTLGRINVGAAVVSAKTQTRRIDIDDEQYIHHIKASSIEVFALWLEQLKQHRLFQQHLFNTSGGADDSGLRAPSRGSSLPRAKFSLTPGLVGSMGSSSPGSSAVQELAALDENLTRQLLSVQQHALSLAMLAQRAEDEVNAVHSNANHGSKSKRLFGLRKKKSGSSSSSVTAPATGFGSSSANSRSSTIRSEKASTSSSVTTASGLSPSEPESPVLSRATADGALSLTSEAAGMSSHHVGDRSSSSTLASMATLSSSNPSLSSMTAVSADSGRPASLQIQDSSSTNKSKQAAGQISSSSLGTSSTLNQSLNATLVSVFDTGVREEMMTLAQDIQAEVSALLRTYTADRDRLKAALEPLVASAGSLGPGSGGSGMNLAALRQTLNQTMAQNAAMRAKLQRIYSEAELPAELQAGPTMPYSAETLMRGLNQSLSYSSSCVSEFFDAREYNTDRDGPSESSSEDDEDLDEETEDAEEKDEAEDDDFESDYYDDEQEEMQEMASSPVASASASGSPSSQSQVLSPGTSATLTQKFTGRRQKLPVPKTDTEGLNLWNLLCKNIGKDLSKISMPVTLNEPLSALQRLCEELEYSELLDKAADVSSSSPVDAAVERMTWVAAFAVSVYGSCQARAGHKPFNPLLGETFECVREDRGFRYVAEQVSHHPPVSACHAVSLNGERWKWAQDLRVKTKFWGKSMEFQPEGTVSVWLRLPDGSSEMYEYNKVTTCIHNLLGGAGDRWVDIYGQCVIKCAARGLTATVNFEKASYWSNRRHEIYGTIVDKNGKVLQHLFGKWSEAVYCGQAPSAKCIWRPAMLPADSHIYYGFSRFAMELNEILESEKHLLPPTDTRFRPDQRMLEEGQISDAENTKLRLEQSQRDRRREAEERGWTHESKWFARVASKAGSGGSERYDFTGDYWRVRQDPGFETAFNSPIDKLW